MLQWLWCCCHTLKVSFLRPKKHGLILIYDPLPPEDSRNFLPVHHREDLSANSCMNSSVCTPFAVNGLVCWDRGLLGACNISQQIRACSEWANFSVCTLDSKNSCKIHLWSKLYTASILKCFGQIYTVSHRSHQQLPYVFTAYSQEGLNSVGRSLRTWLNPVKHCHQSDGGFIFTPVSSSHVSLHLGPLFKLCIGDSHSKSAGR